jgi:hypothetical protein
VKKAATQNTLSRLTRIYQEQSGARRVGPDSQMCLFWHDPTVEILVGSDELDALETEFGIEFDDDNALDLYDMTLSEAAKLIERMVREQGADEHDSTVFIDKLTGKKAKQILHVMWQDRTQARTFIIDAAAKIDAKD